MSTAYRVSAKGLILMDNKALLVRRNNGEWSLPGGRLEEGETPEQAMAREVLEETGIQCKAGLLFHSFVRPRPGMMDIFVVVYQATTNSSFADIKLSPEHNDVGLFTPPEALELNLQHGFRRTLQLAMKTYSQ
jgi:8-oxo-dGTP pyrophosphatase MutT (NUDIX family)